MALFRYEIVDSNGKTLRGVMDAPSEADVRTRLTAKGYRVYNVVPAGQQPRSQTPTPAPGAVTAAKPGVRTSRIGVPNRELIVLFRSLQAYVHAGMNIDQGLAEIARVTTNRNMRVIATRMADRVQAGERLSEAMSEFPRAFPPHVVGLVSAGEVGGVLPAVMGDIVLPYEFAQRASNRWYALLFKLAWFNAFAVLVISPFFGMMFTPGVTDFSSMVQVYLDWTIPRIILPVLGILMLYFIGGTILRQPGMRPTAHRLLLLVPVQGAASRLRSLALFTRILWRLQKAGVLPVQSWEVATAASENVEVARRLREQVPAMRGGAKLSQALNATGYYGGDEARLLAAGEASGQVVDALERLTAYYEDAAFTMAGRARFAHLRLVVMANVITFAVFFYFVQVKRLADMFKWVDWYFGLE